MSDIARGTEVQGGTLARKGTDFYGHVNDAHQASKSKIQESIQRIEKGIETGKGAVKSSGKVYPTRQIDPVAEAHIIDRVKELRGKLTSGYKKSGNFALAEVDVNGLNRKEFYAQSSIDELQGVLAERVPDISLKPNNPIFEASNAADKNGIEYLRDSDTEYKILNDIANRLGDNTEITGKIKTVHRIRYL
ncbi:deaminase domain-containing protein [Bacillus sp. FSL W8-0940]|uniref:deaminase domain-containing protein n=1 Tax=Bacillus sp. FSL W8-0940 TaxID=2954638 RepID=UPI002016D086|nr:deaminase domain-containing protein [Bacillus sonorensis]